MNINFKKIITNMLIISPLLLSTQLNNINEIFSKQIEKDNNLVYINDNIKEKINLNNVSLSNNLDNSNWITNNLNITGSILSINLIFLLGFLARSNLKKITEKEYLLNLRLNQSNKDKYQKEYKKYLNNIVNNVLRESSILYNNDLMKSFAHILYQPKDINMKDIIDSLDLSMSKDNVKFINDLINCNIEIYNHNINYKFFKQNINNYNFINFISHKFMNNELLIQKAYPEDYFKFDKKIVSSLCFNKSCNILDRKFNDEDINNYYNNIIKFYDNKVLLDVNDNFSMEDLDKVIKASDVNLINIKDNIYREEIKKNMLKIFLFRFDKLSIKDKKSYLLSLNKQIENENKDKKEKELLIDFVDIINTKALINKIQDKNYLFTSNENTHKENNKLILLKSELPIIDELQKIKNIDKDDINNLKDLINYYIKNNNLFSDIDVISNNLLFLTDKIKIISNSYNDMNDTLKEKINNGLVDLVKNTLINLNEIKSNHESQLIKDLTIQNKTLQKRI